MKIIKNILCLMLLMSLIIKLPEMHYNYIRGSVGNKVVKITNLVGTSGGTGSHVIAPSGRTYILTNSHVCSHVQENGIVQVTDASGNTLPRRVLLDASFTDLCVVEGMPGQTGLSLGSAPEIGDIVGVVGHPKLMPTTMTRGEIFAETEIEVLDHVMTEDAADKCNLPKNKIETVDTWFGQVKVCVVKINRAGDKRKAVRDIA